MSILQTTIFSLIILFVYSKIHYKEHYINVPIDHYSFSTKHNNTFKLRYLIIEEFYVKGGPILFYCGNEAEVTVFLENSGFLLDIAPTLNALVIFAEHRYYGKSMPFGEKSLTSPENLKYLTVFQALDDFVWIIDKLGNHYYRTMITNDTYPVIAFGGSYGGMLAAWLRMKYPHIVIGAIASSAPILQINNETSCKLFNEIVTREYAKNNNCSQIVKHSWKSIRNITKTIEGKRNASSIFKLCKPVKSAADVSELLGGIANIYVNLAMLNYPYPTNFIPPLPANPVQAICSKLSTFQLATNKTNPLDPLRTIANAIEIYTNLTGSTKCNRFDTNIHNPIEYAWSFQACFELIMPTCSTNEDMFETTKWKYKKFTDDCRKLYGIHSYRSDNILLEFGARKILNYASNIVFSNGLIDPWSSGGIMHNISDSVVAIVIPESAHHLDLRGANLFDSPYIIEARKFHVKMIKKWLKIT